MHLHIRYYRERLGLSRAVKRRGAYAPLEGGLYGTIGNHEKDR